MPRPLRIAPGGFVFHVLNRAHGKRRIFHTDRDYQAFERVLAEVQQRVSMRILAWCLMPNHWHLLLWPKRDGDLSQYMRLVTLTHAQRLHAWRATAGTGQVYQGRFKSFVVQDDRHFVAVARYVEANALNGDLVQRGRKGTDPRMLFDWHSGTYCTCPDVCGVERAVIELNAVLGLLDNGANGISPPTLQPL